MTTSIIMTIQILSLQSQVVYYNYVSFSILYFALLRANNHFIFFISFSMDLLLMFFQVFQEIGHMVINNFFH